jgi:hypothetical protein
MIGHLTAHRLIVPSAPATMFAFAERRDGGLNPREVLDWRRSG